ncbi:MAG: J domain-containing protein [Spirochaetales bacterium]|nr:J domain-containing protein [Spirochaetales bacterium]
MEQKESLRVLGLSETSTLQDLSTVFRKLVKRYHPDLNQGREEWSTRQMHQLNDAYDAAFSYLSRPLAERIIKSSITTKPEPKESFTRYNKTRTAGFSRTFETALQYIYAAMETYYQYGLDRIALRHEGTRRSRYSSSIRKVKKGFELLKPLADSPMTQGEEEELEIAVNFIRYFYKNIHISSLRPADSTAYERKAFRHLTHGSELIDRVIKEIMFIDFVEPFRRGRLSENIKLAEAELNTIIVDYSDAICLRESEIKKELLYSFLDLVDLQEAGRISFY